MLQPDFFLDSLTGNAARLPVAIDAALRAQADGHAVVASRGLDLDVYAALGHAELAPEPTPPPSGCVFWGGEDRDRLETQHDQVVWRVRWQGAELLVVSVSWSTSCGGESRDWVIARTAQQAEEFILDVERKTHSPGESILVFSDGRWSRNWDLYQATRSVSFDDLILADELKQNLRQDFRSFLDAEEHYQRLGVAWRRGALLIGPPGNGKTHCVRALVKELGVASLYVKSMEHRYYTAEQLWEMVFRRARGLRPCCLVLEDLDSLVSPKNRSFFLNQLDGFDQNHGLIVLATTNYPERIDAAIINRPSRFDRKYHFPLPTPEQRRDFLVAWRERLRHETDWPESSLDALARATEGFSFAYLKELAISAVMQWLRDPADGFARVAMDQASLLRGQMASDAAPPPDEHDDD